MTGVPAVLRHAIPLLCVVALWARPARADTWAAASWGFGPLKGASEGPSTASIPQQGFDLFGAGTAVGVVSAAASATQLQLGARAAFATLNSTPTLISLAVSRATAEAADLLTVYGLPAGTSGFIAFKGDVSGSNAQTLSGTNGVGTGITMTQVDTSLIGFRTDSNNATPANGNFPNYDWPVFLPAFSTLEYTQFPVELEFPIVYGTPTGFFFFLISNVRIEFDVTAAITFDGATDFHDTFAITAVELRDGDHMPIAGASLTSRSGTVYPGVGNVTTTTTTLAGATTTTTRPQGCFGLVGLAHAKCLLDAAAGAPLCADAIPARVEQALQRRLGGAREILARAITTTGKKQTRLAKAAGRKVRSLAARARAAAKSTNPKKQITPACGETLQALADAAGADLP